MSGQRIETAEQMLALGESYAQSAKPGDVFGLIGTLGTGKTHWSKGFIRAMDPQAETSSPTFSIVNEYREARLPVFHFDFYRLTSAEELLNLGWDEYLDENGIVICEWADLFPALMPATTQWLQITHEPDGGRKVTPVTDPGNQ